MRYRWPRCAIVPAGKFRVLFLRREMPEGNFSYRPPEGRTYSEYVDMFGLKERELGLGPVLDCPAGASPFAAEANKRGISVIACDLVYGMTSGELLNKGRGDIAHVFEKFDDVAHNYVWTCYRSKEEVMGLRARALEEFAGYETGAGGGRYIEATLPVLPFAEGAFNMVLTGNFLFMYGDRLDLDFHKACLAELARVCSGELRIFPLVGLDFKPYPHLEEIISFLESTGMLVEPARVRFEFQKGANEMLIAKTARSGL